MGRGGFSRGVNLTELNRPSLGKDVRLKQPAHKKQQWWLRRLLSGSLFSIPLTQECCISAWKIESLCLVSP